MPPTAVPTPMLMLLWPTDADGAATLRPPAAGSSPRPSKKNPPPSAAAPSAAAVGNAAVLFPGDANNALGAMLLPLRCKDDWCCC